MEHLARPAFLTSQDFWLWQLAFSNLSSKRRPTFFRVFLKGRGCSCKYAAASHSETTTLHASTMESAWGAAQFAISPVSCLKTRKLGKGRCCVGFAAVSCGCVLRLCLPSLLANWSYRPGNSSLLHVLPTFTKCFAPTP